jgi:hypothetical protein
VWALTFKLLAAVGFACIIIGVICGYNANKDSGDHRTGLNRVANRLMLIGSLAFAAIALLVIWVYPFSNWSEPLTGIFLIGYTIDRALDTPLGLIARVVATIAVVYALAEALLDT